MVDCSQAVDGRLIQMSMTLQIPQTAGTAPWSQKFYVRPKPRLAPDPSCGVGMPPMVHVDRPLRIILRFGVRCAPFCLSNPRDAVEKKGVP
jgi:hypothetical protein